MKLLFRGWERLGGVARGARGGSRETELAEEIAHHLQMLTDANVRAGMSRSQAERAARLKFGGIEGIKESYRDQSRLRWLETLGADVRFALRGMGKSRGFVLAVVAALALGIGASTAVFTVVNAAVLKPAPVYDAERFVVLMNFAPGAASPAASPAKFAFWRARTDVLEDVAAYARGKMNYTGGEVAEQLQSLRVSADFFGCMGTQILRGRGFLPEEDRPNGRRVALIGENLWARLFGNDPRVLGGTIELNGEDYTLIGIVKHDPAVLEFGPLPEVFVPFQLDPNSADQGHYFMTVARLKRGVGLGEAQARLRASAEEFRTKFPGSLPPNGTFSVMPYRDAAVSGSEPLLLVLSGAVVLVLMIACANVACLLLARATERRREFAIRAAIGAGRGRLMRQLLTESLLLSLTGGVLGLLLGYAGIRALLAVNTAGLPRLGENGAAVAMDWRVMGFALGLSVLTGILFGLVPALAGSKADLDKVLKESSGKAGTGLRQNKVRAALVACEVGLAVVLLIGSALLIRTFVALRAVNPGFDSNNVVTMRMALTGPRYRTPAGAAAAMHEGVSQIRALPGIAAAAASCCVPLENGFVLPFNVVNRPAGDGMFTGTVGWSPVSAGYFDVYKIPVKRGRAFTDRDGRDSPPVALVNEAMARRYWPDGDPLGDRIMIGRGALTQFRNEPSRQIIGIVGDVRDGGLGLEPRPQTYVPLEQVSDRLNSAELGGAMAWVVRTEGDSRRVALEVRDQLRVATGLPASDVRSMDEVVSLSTARRRFNMLLMSGFAGAALLLAGIGVYGLMAYTVEQRTRDFGIRLALGASASEVRNMMVRQGALLAVAGAAAGLAAAWAVTWAMPRVMESLLFGVTARDPLVFVAAPLVLLAVALAAVWRPAKRASRVSPVESLRYE